MGERTAASGVPRHLVLYDGVCGLCNWFTRFIIPRDHDDRFRFASIQSDYATRLVRRLGGAPESLETVYVIPDYEGASPRLLERSEAVLFVLEHLGGVWRGGRLLRILPRRVLDRFYGFIASRRYGWFGRYDACPMPTPETRRKFLATE